MAERAFPGKRVEANGLTFHVVDEGDGPAVVLLHGFPDTADLWRYQVRALVDAGRRVVAPDLRGFGDSDRPGSVDDYFLFNGVADVRGILDALGIERASVVGHDFGAGVAWALAIAEAERVERMVAISVGHPAVFTRPSFDQLRRSWYTFVFQFPGVAEELFSRDDFQLLREWAGRHPDIDASIERFREPGAFTAALSWYRANLRPEIWSVDVPFPAAEVPVLGIWGAQDPYLSEAQVTNSAELVPDWRYERIEGAGHWIQLDRPDELNALLLDFLKGAR